MKWRLEEWFVDRWQLVKLFRSLDEANAYADQRAGCHRITKRH